MNNASSNPSWFSKTLRGAVPSMALMLLLTASPSVRAQLVDRRAPAVPPAIKVPDGSKVHFRTDAIGVQIYVWNGTSWVFQAPEAVLFQGNRGVVGTHYAGPTWESNSGSKVVAARVNGATVDATAIPWLLLRVTSAEGPGVLASTTYIQRVNTTGGLAPSTPGTATGQVARVPYTAEYFFFRAHSPSS